MENVLRHVPLHRSLADFSLHLGLRARYGSLTQLSIGPSSAAHLFFLVSPHRNRGAEQDHEGDLRHAGRLPLLLHRLHDATVDRLRHQGVEDAAGRPVHDLGGQHPPVVVRLLADEAPRDACSSC